MARDNSEDAVTWNVFRFLEKNNLIEGFLSMVAGQCIKSSEVIYWSYRQEEDKAWTLLNKAREEFGEEIRRSSEPDLIIKTDKALFFIEAKLTAGNETMPSDMKSSKRYETGGNDWFREVFKSDYKTIAITEKKYELMRFWLLGTWMAEQSSLEFYLINLVRKVQGKNIETAFKKHIKEDEKREFNRLTWENVCEYILNSGVSPHKEIIIRFFRNKTFGYDKNGKLRKAFLV